MSSTSLVAASHGCGAPAMPDPAEKYQSSIDAVDCHVESVLEDIRLGRELTFLESPPILRKIPVWEYAAEMILEFFLKREDFPYPVEITVNRDLLGAGYYLGAHHEMQFVIFRGMQPSHTAIVANYEVTTLPLRVFAGGLAHEIGHLVNQDPKEFHFFSQKLDALLAKGKITPLRHALIKAAEHRAREYAADSYAIQAGFGRELLCFLRAVQKTQASLPKKDLLRCEVDLFSSHPSISKRIARIERLLSAIIVK